MTIWLDFKGIMLSEISQRHLLHSISCMWNYACVRVYIYTHTHTHVCVCVCVCVCQAHIFIKLIRYRKQISGCQRWGVVVKKLVEFFSLA